MIGQIVSFIKSRCTQSCCDAHSTNEIALKITDEYKNNDQVKPHFHEFQKCIQTLNINTDLVEFITTWFPEKQLEICNRSPTALIFKSDKFVLKSFKPTELGYKLAVNEIHILKSLKQRGFETPLVDEYNDTEARSKHIVLHNYGLDAFDLIRTNKCSKQAVRRLMYDIPRIVDHLEKLSICHRDIKPENITFDGEKWRLIDFGFSCPYGDRRTAVGTVPYILPSIGKRPVGSNFMDVNARVDRFAACMTILFFFIDLWVKRRGNNNSRSVPVGKLISLRTGSLSLLLQHVSLDEFQEHYIKKLLDHVLIYFDTSYTFTEWQLSTIRCHVTGKPTNYSHPFDESDYDKSWAVFVKSSNRLYDEKKNEVDDSPHAIEK